MKGLTWFIYRNKKCFQLPDLALLGLTQSLARRQEVYTHILPMGLWILINQLTEKRDWKSR
jgi:hypothetical protein